MAELIRSSLADAQPKSAPVRSIFPRLREPFNGLSHLVAALLALGGGVWLATGAIQQAKPLHALSFVIFTLGLVLLYSASATYHLLSLSPSATRWLRRVDHMMIYVLIASTYTPFCLVVLPGNWALGILAAIWGLAVSGTLLSIFYLDKPRWLTVSIYIFMGWFSLVAIQPLVERLSAGGLFWVVAGGITYTLGAVIYALKRPRLLPGLFGFHEVWHLFVIGGSFCHFVALTWI